MSGYYVYLPKARARPDDFQAAGCGELLAGNGPTAFSCHAGPDGGSGTLFAWQGQRATLPQAAYVPDRQRWEPCKPRSDRAAGAFWIGCDLAAPPRPEDLALTTMRDGYYVELADGQKWLLPEAERLPRKWGLLPSGDFGKIVAAPFGEFCLASERMQTWCATAGREGEPMTDTQLWLYCVQALAVNYRVNVDVVDFLGLIVEDAVIVGGQAEANATVTRILRATLGAGAIELIEADQKKTA